MIKHHSQKAESARSKYRQKVLLLSTKAEKIPTKILKNNVFQRKIGSDFLVSTSAV